ncbi:MAG: AlpA family phage regulatory protein [Balneolaceae bacterium]|nr:AlpA family phage regulatory protein [Balneolaceae bacterium]MCH8550158.1 AlpA family phage regulatory protein [Balneolaceae bacterium]
MSKIKIIRPAELAKLLSVSRSTIWRMVQNGELPPCRKVSNRCVGWIESDIMEWVTNLPTVK